MSAVKKIHNRRVDDKKQNGALEELFCLVVVFSDLLRGDGHLLGYDRHDDRDGATIQRRYHWD